MQVYEVRYPRIKLFVMPTVGSHLRLIIYDLYIVSDQLSLYTRHVALPLSILLYDDECVT